MSTVVVPRALAAVLGPVRVAGRAPGALIEPAGPRAKALVVALTIAGPDGVSIGRLVDDLWGEEPPRGAKAALQTLVSRLRQNAADDVIVSTATGYRLGDAGGSDLAAARHFLSAARSSAAGDPSEADRLATAALELWRGDPAGDVVGFDLLDDLAHEASATRDGLLRVAAAARCDLGDLDGCLAALDSLAPTLTGLPDEKIVELRIRALTGAGRRNDAVQIYADYREQLADALGTTPGRALVAANAAALAGDDEEPSRDRTGPLTGDAPATRRSVTVGLRAAPNELLGRDADIAAVEALLSGSRLVTVLGPGGLGKTRLAQEVARRASRVTSRVVVVELAGVRSEEDVVLAVAGALGIREIGATRASRLRLADPGVRRDIHDRLEATLLEMPTLLVLDNCEHVVDAVAELSAEMLAETDDVRILTTSRSPLAMSAEAVHPLGALPSSGAATALFVQRARAARPGVALPAGAVARLCERLDGLPLAIELAAARVRSMAVDEIERRLGNRFALLTTGDRSAPERHRTLTAVIDWSWNLLSSDERALLRRLSRFPDGFSADAAERVGSLPGDGEVASVLDGLDGLVTQSLISVVDEPGTGRTRYRMLETVREFGDLRLVEAGEGEAVRAAMFRWAEWFADDIRGDLDGARQIQRFAEMRAEQDDLVFVLRDALALRRPGTVAECFAVLGYFWTMSGSHADVNAFGPDVIDLLRRTPAEPQHRDAELLSAAMISSVVGFGRVRAGLLALGRVRHLKKAGPAQDPRLDAMTTLLLACLTDFDRFRPLLTQMVGSADPVIVELASVLSGQLAENEGDVDAAYRLALAAHESAARHGHVWAAATSATSLAELTSQSGDPAAALEWAMVARDGLTKLGATGDLRDVEFRVAMAELSLGRVDAARVTFEAQLADDSGLGDERGAARLLGGACLAEVAFLDGRPADGGRLYREALEAFRGERGGPRSPLDLLIGAAAVAAQIRAGAEAGPLANRLRTRLIATSRVAGSFEDVPIAGAAVFATGVWILGSESLRLDLDEAARTGVRLAALAERMHARQELPSLEQGRVLLGLSARFSDSALDGARAEVADLAPRDAYRAALALLADRRLRP